MKQNQFKFKPFDQVLVRDEDDECWRIEIYSYFQNDEISGYNHVCLTQAYKQCIPYNENTAHLFNTNNPYQTVESKKWVITDCKTGVHYMYSDTELRNFINSAVINNKDITIFHVMPTNHPLFS